MQSDTPAPTPPSQPPAAPSLEPTPGSTGPPGPPPEQPHGPVPPGNGPPQAPDLGPHPPGGTPHRLPALALIAPRNFTGLFGVVTGVLALLRSDVNLMWTVLGLIVAATLAVIGRTLWWLRFRWGFDGQVVRVAKGLLWQQEVALDVARIQQVDVHRPLLQQLLGLATLTVETASQQAGSELAISGMHHSAATDLRQAVLHARQHSTTTTAASPATTTPTEAPTATGPADPDRAPSPPLDIGPARSLAKPSTTDLLKHAVTGAALLVLPATAAAVMGFANELVFNLLDLQDDVVEPMVTGPSTIGWTAAVVGLGTLTVVTLLGAVGSTLLNFWDVELSLEGDDLRLTRGLLNKTTTTIPLRRLQIVTWSGNFVRRRWQVGSLELHSAGNAAADASQSQSPARTTAVIPWVHRAQLDEILPVLLARVVETGEQVPLTVDAHPPAAQRRLRFQWFRSLLWTWGLLAGVGVSALHLADVFTAATVPLAALGVVVVAAGLAWVLGRAQYRRLGHHMDADLLVVSRGVLGEFWDWVPVDRVQGVEGHDNWFQRRLGVGTLVINPAGVARDVTVRDASREQLSLLADRLLLIASGGTSRHAPPLSQAPVSALDPNRVTRRLQRSVMLLWLLRAVWVGIGLALATAIGVVALASQTGTDPRWTWVAVACAAGALCAIPIPWMWARHRWDVGPNALHHRHGLYRQRWTVLPWFRVQHLATASGPLRRRLDLATVEVASASLEIVVDGVSLAQSTAISDDMLARTWRALKASAPTAHTPVAPSQPLADPPEAGPPPAPSLE